MNSVKALKGWTGWLLLQIVFIIISELGFRCGNSLQDNNAKTNCRAWWLSLACGIGCVWLCVQAVTDCYKLTTCWQALTYIYCAVSFSLGDFSLMHLKTSRQCACLQLMSGIRMYVAVHCHQLFHILQYVLTRKYKISCLSVVLVTWVSVALTLWRKCFLIWRQWSGYLSNEGVGRKLAGENELCRAWRQWEVTSYNTVQCQWRW